MEPTEIMVWVLFPLMIYLVCAMPSKSDIRRAVGSVSEAGRPAGWRASLESLQGSSCTLVLDEAQTVALGIEVTGIVLDVDDEWVLLEVEGAKGGTRLVALRLEQIRSIEER